MAARSLEDHLFGEGPQRTKRILSLDGGGVRGLITLGILKEVETLLAAQAAKRGENPEDFRLSDYFDLIGGTSTGGIIATLLALGFRVDKIQELYREMCPRIFPVYRIAGIRIPTIGLFKSVFDSEKFAQEIDRVINDFLAENGQAGQTLTLGSSLFKTGLAIVTKRIDRGSVWVLTNNPHAKYWAPDSKVWPLSESDSKAIPNRDYDVKKIVCATASAPWYFDPVKVDIAPDQRGIFIDGGASPFNNPVQALFLMTTLRNFASERTFHCSPYGFDWPTGADNLYMLSVGTGIWKTRHDDVDAYFSQWNSVKTVEALRGMIDDSMRSSVTWMQAISEPTKPFFIDWSLERMANMRIVETPLLTFHHVNPLLELGWFAEHERARQARMIDCPECTFVADDIGKMRMLENAGLTNMQRLGKVGTFTGKVLLDSGDFPAKFYPETA